MTLRIFYSNRIGTAGSWIFSLWNSRSYYGYRYIGFRLFGMSVVASFE